MSGISMHLMATQKELGRLLRTARLEEQLGQEAVVAATGISQTHVSKIESGDSLPALDTAVKLAKAVGANVARVRELVIRGRVLKSFEREDVDFDELMRATADVLRLGDLTPEQLRELVEAPEREYPRGSKTEP